MTTSNIDNVRDPFELDRLADELATRESVSQLSTASTDLPLLVPLSHDNPYLTQDPFNVEEFLVSRSHISLPDLRAELKDYLSTLKEELVKLINDDYEAFISLSTDLRGEGTRLERLQYPLGGLKREILISRQELQAIQDAIQDKLKQRAILREEKALLHLLLRISESVTRLETLLLITSPGDNPDSNEPKPPSHLKSMEHEEVDDRVRGSHAKHLGRVAAEYTQLLYHASKAQAEKCKFVDEVQWRIDRIKSTLSSDLDHLFASTLLALTEGKGNKTTDVEKAKWMADLTECLRTYDILSLWRDAEDVLRRELVREFVKKTIYPGALAAPPSPIVPHTPFPIVSKSLAPPTASFLHTPYTPFTAFTSKQNISYLPSTGPQAYFLDETENPLARLYNQILRFVERDLGRIMEIADRVSVKSTTPRQDEGFEIMANVIWAEFGRAIMDDLGSAVFSAGRPDEFRKHHETTRMFIRSLEFLAPSVEAVQAMRAHQVYVAFERRWQLHVYFQLRWKEIVTKLEEELSTTKIEPLSSTKKSFSTVQASGVWTAILTCWSSEVYISDLSHRFWKLTLQLLSRYKTWLEDSIPASEHPSKTLTIPGEKLPSSPSNISRVSTPLPSSDPPSAESTAADDILLRQYATVISDMHTMNSQLLSLWREEISMMLPDMDDLEGGEFVKGEDALRSTLDRLVSIVPKLSNQIIAILTRRCCDALLAVRSVPSQFRAMSNKRPPTEPSYFVSTVLGPLKSFFSIGTNDGPGSALRKDYLQHYVGEVFESVCQRYIYYLTAMKKTEESLRRLKRGQVSTFSLFGSSNSGRDDERRDEERIRTQMILDVNAFGKDAETLGVDILGNETFTALHNLVHADIEDN